MTAAPSLGFSHAPLLSAREEQIVRLIAQGLSSKEIAQALYISPKTVDTHRHHIHDKLGGRGSRSASVVDVVHYALARGIVRNKFQSSGFWGS